MDNNAPSSPKKVKRSKKDKCEGKNKKFRGETEELVEQVEEADNHVQIESGDSEVSWTDETHKLLLSRIEGQLPKPDTLSFSNRLKKINWDDVKFESYSSDQCKSEFHNILNKIRKYRTLTEILEDAVKVIDAPPKKKTDPNKPRQPVTSYIIYYLEKRPKLAKKYPDMKQSELTRKIAERFKNLPPEKKQKYVDKAERNKEEYQQNLKKYYELHPELIPVEVEKKKKTNPAGLLKPQPPFKNYCDKKLKEHESEDKNFDQKAFVAKCKEKWNRMSDRKKFVWIKWTVEREAEYMEKMKVFQAEHPEKCSLNDFKSVLLKEEKALFDRMCGKPEKPPTNAYRLFCRDFMKTCNGTAIEKMKTASEQWKTMTNNQKMEYTDLLNQLKRKYQSEFAAYLEQLPEERRRAELDSEKALIKQKAALASKRAETKCNALENFVKRQNKQIEAAAKVDKKYLNEPIAPPKKVEDYFIQKYMKEHLTTAVQARSVWDALSEKKKLKYNEELIDVKNNYIKSYEKFLKSLGEESLAEYGRLKKIREQQENEDSGEDEDDEDEEEEEAKKDEEEEDDNEGDEERDSKESQNEENDESDTESSND